MVKLSHEQCVCVYVCVFCSDVRWGMLERRRMHRCQRRGQVYLPFKLGRIKMPGGFVAVSNYPINTGGQRCQMELFISCRH